MAEKPRGFTQRDKFNCISGLGSLAAAGADVRAGCPEQLHMAAIGVEPDGEGGAGTRHKKGCTRGQHPFLMFIGRIRTNGNATVETLCDLDIRV